MTYSTEEYTAPALTNEEIYQYRHWLNHGRRDLINNMQSLMMAYYAECPVGPAITEKHEIWIENLLTELVVDEFHQANVEVKESLENNAEPYQEWQPRLVKTQRQAHASGSGGAITITHNQD